MAETEKSLDQENTDEIDIVQALRDKYCAGADDLDMFVLSVRSSKVPVDLVGAKQVASKQAQLDHLRDASISGSAASRAGDIGLLSKTAPNIQQLDISRCKFAGFSELVSITAQLPRLTSLDISGNKLGASGAAALAASAPNLRVLVLNHTGVSWADVVTAVTPLSNLQELHVGYNDITVLDPAPSLPSLELLDISGNKLSHWDDANAISAWPALHRLLLVDNPLHEIRYCGGFSSETSLVISRTQISDWSSIDALSMDIYNYSY